MQDLTLERGARLLHIGPPKTGTTTIQGAFHQARKRLPEHGVLYAGGAQRQPAWAALAITGKGTKLVGYRPATMSDWTALVDEVAAAGDQRVVVSSEFFADADDDTAHRVVTEVGGERAHVVVTLRPLTSIIVSQWQQYLQNGLRKTYDEWLDAMFTRPPNSPPTPTFWQRHRHDRLVERWAAAVGTDNVTVVVPDQSEPRMLLATFESLLGLPAGFLVPEQELTNRSLTLGEAELVRLLNVEFRREGWPETVYGRMLRSGAILQMKTAHRPLPGEPMITTPTWAQERASEIGAEAAAKIEAMGVRIVGDIDSLGHPPVRTTDSADDVAAQLPMLSAASAAQAVLGTITASGALSTSPPRTPPPRTPPPRTPPPRRVRDRPVREVDARNLARILTNRGRRRLRKILRRN